MLDNQRKSMSVCYAARQPALTSLDPGRTSRCLFWRFLPWSCLRGFGHVELGDGGWKSLQYLHRQL